MVRATITDMTRRTDPAGIRYARMEGALTGLRDTIRLAGTDGRQVAAREQWHELWERIDQALEILEERPGR